MPGGGNEGGAGDTGGGGGNSGGEGGEGGTMQPAVAVHRPEWHSPLTVTSEVGKQTVPSGIQFFSLVASGDRKELQELPGCGGGIQLGPRIRRPQGRAAEVAGVVQASVAREAVLG